jgi:S1-C subfamily serine protease
MRLPSRLLPAVAAIALAAFAARADEATLAGGVEATVARALPSVVTLRGWPRDVRRTGLGGALASILGASGPIEAPADFGSGVVLRPDGLVVTNNHVLGGSAYFEATLADGRTFAAVPVWRDAGADLAFVALKGAAGLTPMPLAVPGVPALGARVVAIGNPYDIGLSVSDGIVAGLARGGARLGRGPGLLQSTAPLYPGNSGGALVGIDGRLIGITTSVMTGPDGGRIPGISFAIPAQTVLDAMAASGLGLARAAGPWFGAAGEALGRAEGLAEGLAAGGIRLTFVDPASPFARAGIGAGAILIAAGETPLREPGDLEVAALKAGPGAALTVRYRQDGAEGMVRVVAAPPPGIGAPEAEVEGGPDAGARLAEVTPWQIVRFGLPPDAAGVVVAAGGRDESGLRAGDLLLAVEGRAPGSAEEAARALSRGGARWEVLRNGERIAGGA